jgi:DNA-binding winged helix-turn-helix (wHTH) protein
MTTSYGSAWQIEGRPGTTVLFAFGDFTLDVAAYRLSRAGEALEVQPQTFDALRYLVEHRERAVTADELRREVWADGAAGMGSVWWTVYRIRRLLGQTRLDDGPVQSAGRRGYRFIAPVHIEVRVPSPADRSDAWARPRAIPADGGRLGTMVRATLLRRAQRTRSWLDGADLGADRSFAERRDEERKLRALGLLEEDAMSIDEVAACVGYSTPGGFTRAFRAWIGTTPRIYQREYRAMMGDSLAAGLGLAEDAANDAGA